MKSTATEEQGGTSGSSTALTMLLGQICCSREAAISDCHGFTAPCFSSWGKFEKKSQWLLHPWEAVEERQLITHTCPKNLLYLGEGAAADLLRLLLKTVLRDSHSASQSKRDSSYHSWEKKIKESEKAAKSSLCSAHRYRWIISTNNDFQVLVNMAHLPSAKDMHPHRALEPKWQTCF